MTTFLNRQEMFDAIVKGIKRQKGFGFTKCPEFNVCNYLTADGHRQCAIGILLGKPFVRKHVLGDRNGAEISILLNVLKDEGVKLPDWLNSKNLKFLTALQEAHDNAADMPHMSFEQWEHNMLVVAKKYRIDPSLLKKTDWKKLDGAST